jgi:radical SAM protein with 4Fe4S-binding SPASM domain
MADHHLRVLFWETTAACNLRCRHCRRGEVRATAVPGELTTGEAMEFIRGVASWSRPLLVMSGGEPLTRGDIVELAACASECGLPVALATNGTLAGPGIAAALKKAGVRRVSVSVDGIVPETHDRIRGVAGAFEGAVRGLRTLRGAGLSTQVNMTVCRGNRGEIAAMFRLAAREGADAVHLFVLVPVGCGLDLAKDEALSPAEGRELLEWFHTRAGSFGMEARLTCAPQYVRYESSRGPDALLRQSGRGDVRPPRKDNGDIIGTPSGGNAAGSGCLCGRSVCFVSHGGELFPCGYLPVSVGNVRAAGLRELWDESALFRELRDPGKLGAPCGACRFRDACGGCRARAYAATGNYLAGDITCGM